MTVRVAANDREGALRTYQSSFAMVAAISMSVLLLASTLVWVIPWHRWMHLSSVSDRQAAEIVLVFGAYIVATQQCGVLESGYRCDGNFALATLWLTILRLLEALLACVVCLLTGNLLGMAFAYLTTRIVGTLFFGLFLRRKSPWLRLGRRPNTLGGPQEPRGSGVGIYGPSARLRHQPPRLYHTSGCFARSTRGYFFLHPSHSDSPQFSSSERRGLEPLAGTFRCLRSR